MRKIKSLTIIVLVLIISAFTTKEIINKTDKGYKIGDIATDFKLMNIDDNTISLSDFKDAKGFIIVFTCNTCPYAVMYEDRIEALNKKYASKGYPVIAIMPNSIAKKPGDSLEDMKIRAKEKGFTFPYLIDKDQSVYPQYGTTKTPHTYILQKTDKGNMVKYIGAIDNNYKDVSQVTEKYVEKAIESLLKGEDIKKTKTKAIGCSIKA